MFIYVSGGSSIAQFTQNFNRAEMIKFIAQQMSEFTADERDRAVGGCKFREIRVCMKCAGG